MAADQSMDQRVLYAATEVIQRLGYSTMKPEQLHVVSGIVSARDAFAVLPTGFGKSLCYACPPTVFDLVLPVEGTSTVFAVAPLTAIMKDQVSVTSRRTYLRPQLHKRGKMLRNNYIPQRIIAFRVDKSMY